jgi:hypothetical protein
VAAPKVFVALYGNVKMLRTTCPTCEGTALVLRGKTACCGTLILDAPSGFKRMSVPVQARRLPPVEDREAVLLRQDHRCIYCERAFGGVVFLGTQPMFLTIEWDHFVPFVYSQNNGTLNFAAACQICNGIKSAKFFHTIEEARLYVTQARRAKGYSDV